MSLSQLVNSDDDENDMLKIIVLSGFDRSFLANFMNKILGPVFIPEERFVT